MQKLRAAASKKWNSLEHWQIAIELFWCFCVTVLAHLFTSNDLVAIFFEFLAVLPITIQACILNADNKAHKKLLDDICSKAREGFVEYCRQEKLILQDATCGDFSIYFFVKKDARLECHEINAICIKKLNSLGNRMTISIQKSNPESFIAEAYHEAKTKARLTACTDFWGASITTHNKRLLDSLHSKVAVAAMVYDDKSRVVAVALVTSSRDVCNKENSDKQNSDFSAACESFADEVWGYYTTVKHI